MSYINAELRKKINYNNRNLLNNINFSLISSNCVGGGICNDLGLRFRSPFVNLWVKPDDYIRLLQSLDYYMSCEIVFIKEDGINYPVGILGHDVKLYFQHYKTEEEAYTAWNRRKKRLNKNNLFILFTDRDGCTYQNLLDFENLPYPHKVVFTHKKYPELTSSFYIKGFETKGEVGICSDYVNRYSGKKIYDAFDYVSWFNSNRDMFWKIKKLHNNVCAKFCLWWHVLKNGGKLWLKKLQTMI